MSIEKLMLDLEKTVHDLFNHPDFEDTANDLITDAEDAEPVIEEGVTDKHMLLTDFLNTITSILVSKIK